MRVLPQNFGCHRLPFVLSLNTKHLVVLILFSLSPFVSFAQNWDNLYNNAAKNGTKPEKDRSTKKISDTSVDQYNRRAVNSDTSSPENTYQGFHVYKDENDESYYINNDGTKIYLEAEKSLQETDYLTPSKQKQKLASIANEWDKICPLKLGDMTIKHVDYRKDENLFELNCEAEMEFSPMRDVLFKKVVLENKTLGLIQKIGKDCNTTIWVKISNSKGKTHIINISPNTTIEQLDNIALQMLARSGNENCPKKMGKGVTIEDYSVVGTRIFLVNVQTSKDWNDETANMLVFSSDELLKILSKCDATLRISYFDRASVSIKTLDFDPNGRRYIVSGREPIYDEPSDSYGKSVETYTPSPQTEVPISHTVETEPVAPTIIIVTREEEHHERNYERDYNTSSSNSYHEDTPSRTENSSGSRSYSPTRSSSSTNSGGSRSYSPTRSDTSSGSSTRSNTNQSSSAGSTKSFEKSSKTRSR